MTCPGQALLNTATPHQEASGPLRPVSTPTLAHKTLPPARHGEPLSPRSLGRDSRGEPWSQTPASPTSHSLCIYGAPAVSWVLPPGPHGILPGGSDGTSKQGLRGHVDLSLNLDTVSSSFTHLLNAYGAPALCQAEVSEISLET